MDRSGERFIPQQADPFDEIAVEHQQRYHSVLNLVRGKTVLDAGSGEGYGAHLLAQIAARVVGIDISEEAVENARATYPRPNLEYRVGSLEELPFEDASFDVVVSFEVIEHLDESLQFAFLHEARRVIKPAGVLVISTPNKAIYTDHSNQHNRFHKKEFYIDEFELFLGRVFPRVSSFGQSWVISSALQKSFSPHLANLKLSDQASFSPKYVVAVCGATEFVDTVDLASVVIDPQRKHEAMWDRIIALQTEVAGRNAWVSSLEQDLSGLQKRIVALQEEVEGRNSWIQTLEQDLSGLQKRIAALQEEVEGRNSWIQALEQDLSGSQKRIVALQEEVEGKNSWIAALQEEVEGRNSWIQALEQDLHAAQKRVVELQEEVEAKNTWAFSLQQEIDSAAQAVSHYKSEAETAHQRIAELNAQNESLLNINTSKEVELARVRTELDLIKQSDFWRIATRYWRARDALLPHGSRRRFFLKRIFRSLKPGTRTPSQIRKLPPLGRETSQTDDPAIAQGQDERPSTKNPAVRNGSHEYAGIEFARVDHPKVSILIPVFNQWAHTYECLKSVQRTMSGVACEIILADDGSIDLTARAAEFLTGIKLLRDGKNRGFLRNCNWAACQARGEYLYILNNDTELRPAAIQTLVALLNQDPTIGMVGSKLIFPDGRIQEAGGIIWADASGWNFGRGQDPSLPAFNYVKEVDYISGASFMIRTGLWKEIGGFDDRYAPAYCEDSDLAFEVRKRGFKVVYQPQSVVVHFEGVSHGTDVSNNTKTHQVKNTEILKTKWASVLSQHLPNGTDVFHARDRSAGRKAILIIDHYVPQVDRDAGSRTMWSFIQSFLKMGMNVKFIGDNFFPHQPYTDMLQQAGIEVLTGPWFADHWPEWLQENGRCLDYVLLSRPHIAPKYVGPVRAHSNAQILYYVHDLHFLRESQMADLRNDPSLKAVAEKTKEEEQHLMSQMDVIFSCSDIEVNIVRELCPKTEVVYIPPYSIDVDFTRPFNAAERDGILFVGGFSHPPNGDGVSWFIREVWPVVKKQLPRVVFKVAGSDPPPEILALASDDVNVLGFVSDERLRELYRKSRLVVIPLRYGAGVKGKTVEAMAHGVPVVSTAFGVEGMPGVEEILDPAQHCLPIAEGIVALYGDSSRLEEISRRERAYVAQHFTLERIKETFEQVLVPARTRIVEKT